MIQEPRMARDRPPIRPGTDRGVFAVLTASCLALAACEEPTGPRACTAIAVDALAVTVVDAASLARICDATVVAVDGAFSSELRRWPAGDVCVYSGPTERPGRYEIRASRSGYEAGGNLTVVNVTADECHVIPVSVTVQLRPLTR
jgi:hypothetical protein